MATRLAVALVVMVLAGCSGTPPPSVAPATPRSTPRPTPTPGPSPWSSGWPLHGYDASAVDAESALRAACSDGTPVPGAAPYAGKVHPLIVVDQQGHWSGFDINQEFPWSPWSWPSPIQLLVCVPANDEKQVGSCGSYKNEAGEVGEVLRYKDSVTVRVVVAETGKTLQKKVLANPAPKCPKNFTVTGNFEWRIIDEVTAEQVNEYATAVSTQQVQ